MKLNFERPQVVNWGAIVLMALLSVSASAQSPAASSSPGPSSANREKPAEPAARNDALRQFNTSLESLVAKVSPAVVEILVTGYGAVGESDGSAGLIARQRSLGSGVIVDPDGYIVTNAHVVKGAQRIQVVLTPSASGETAEPMETADYFARLVGVHQETDLALLKIEAHNLPHVNLDPTHPVHQGELVIALGSPQGLGNSVTMGIVSSVDRQPDPEMPMVFIQTDAPINRGNSGGPLVDIDGHVVGLNTFILSQGGGSEGLGFAIPARVVDFVYHRLRQFGHVDRSEVGAAAAAITPVLAEGLHLPVSSGVIICDVAPGGPAESAGLTIGDIVLQVDGRQINSMARLAGSLYLHPTDQLMVMEVLRGKEKLTLHIPVLSEKHDVDQLLSLADPQENLVEPLGVLGIDLDSRTRKIMPILRSDTGVVVVARMATRRIVDVGLSPGDIIHSVNTTPVSGLRSLRAALNAIKSGDAVVLQIERGGSLDYLAFEME
jgi:serine protease Do